MDDNAAYQLIKEEGARRQARRFILLIGTARFGEPTPRQAARVNRTADLDRLEWLEMRVFQADSWDELFRARWRPARRPKGGAMRADPWERLAARTPSLSARQDTLLATGLCRTVPAVVTSVALTVALDWLERYADTADELTPEEARRYFDQQTRSSLDAYGVDPSASAVVQAALTDASHQHLRDMIRDHWPDRPDAERLMAGVLADILDGPTPPPPFPAAWRSATAVTLARRMYDVCTFDRMPILADALEDAGCDTADVLSHCRDPHGVHVRGCWVVDLVLGRG